MQSAELIAILREVRDRVRARYPQTAAPGNIALPDLMPLVHARDAAMGKAASIGMVNPRRGGPFNAVAQAGKRLLARMLDWHVREQVVFNRKMIDCLDAAIEALNDSNRAFTELAGRLATVQQRTGEITTAHEQLDQEIGDVRSHWSEWRHGWEHKLAQNEVQFLRSVADLQGAFQQRVTLMDTGYREMIRCQHSEFTAALERNAKQVRDDLERMRLDYDRMIHSELRLIRQRSAPAQLADAPMPQNGTLAGATARFDYARFAERFRGSEEYVKATQQFYLPYFTGRKNVLDIGCGRGEFLEMLAARGVPARGIDLSAESAALCKQKGLDAEAADLFPYLANLAEGSLDGVFCSQVVEHLPPDQVPGMIKLAASRLAPGGVIALETPNPECLAIFSTHFYLDPTHTRPIPHPLLVFYLEEFGVGKIIVQKLSPAVDSMPSLASLPSDFREAFFGGLDYAVIGTRL